MSGGGGGLYYRTVNDRLARQLKDALGGAFETARQAKTATVLNAQQIAVDGQRYPLDTAALGLSAGDTLSVENRGRLAAAVFLPSTASSAAASSSGGKVVIGYGEITADKLSVNLLSAITANMGFLRAGQIVVGDTDRLWLNDANDGGLAIGGNDKARAPFRVTKTGNVTLADAYVGEPTDIHLRIEPALLEFRNAAGQPLLGFDPLGHTIYGAQRIGNPHGPGIEMLEFTDETGELRYRFTVLGANGVPGISFVTGNASDPDDYRVLFGPEGSEYYMKFLSGILTLAASVILLGGSIDKPLTLGLEGGIYQGSGTFAAPDTGLKLWNSGGVGKLFSFAGGVEQAGFDTDGKFKWAAGKGSADNAGLHIKLTGVGTDSQALDFTASESDSVRASLYATETLINGSDVVLEINGLDGLTPSGNAQFRILATSSDHANGYIRLQAFDSDKSYAAIGADEITLTADHVIVPDATADTDVLNRQTGDARYAAIAGAHAAVTLAADAQEVLNLSTQEIGLVAQTANQVLAGPTSGAAADPDFRALVAADLPAATESAQGAAELATVGEAATGTDTGRTVTPEGLPLRVIGSGWALKQPAGSAPGGNNRGTCAVDLQFVRGSVTQVASGDGAYLAGDSNTASGKYSSVIGGYSAVADKYGQQAYAAGSFTAAGDAQRSVYVLRKATTDATPAVLLLNPYPFAPVYLTIADDTVWNFRAEVVAMTADAAGYAAYTVTGLIRRANGTVTVHGVTTVTITESAAGWDATAVADDTNKALSIQVTGKAATTIRWVASVYTTEVSFSS